MSPRPHSLVLVLVVGAGFATAVPGDEKPPAAGPACGRMADDYFKDEVWAKVGVRTCLTCHKPGGDAEKSKFVLADPRKSEGAARDEAMRHNRDAFARMAALKEKDQSRLLLKVVGELDHGGEDVLKPDSAGYRVLADFVRRVNGPATGIDRPSRSTRRRRRSSTAS